MAKTSTKTAAKEPKKTSSALKTTASTNSSPNDALEKVCEEVLEKLKALDIEPQLQSDMEWCLGSYRADKNPIGLYMMAERALFVFQEEKTKKTKGITTKLVNDLEKVIQSRPSQN